MLDNRHVLDQRITVTVSKEGAMTYTLVIKTNAQHGTPDFTELAQAIVEYLEANPQLDRAEVDCTNP
jgi:hypothetical protein